MNLETRLRSAAMRRLSSAGFQQLTRQRARLGRRLTRQPPAVHYFHQVDDPYSHLAVQRLDTLRATYALPFVAHLVSHPDASFLGNSEHYGPWARNDAASIASAYQVTFPANHRTPALADVAAANDELAGHLTSSDFAQNAAVVGEALWSGAALEGAHTGDAGRFAVARGNALRHKLGHYLGGMFYFDGEWYWGIDRLRLLEQRLIDEGYAGRAVEITTPQPTALDTTVIDAQHVLLEYFPSLRSPYTAVGHPHVLSLIKRSGVTVKLRPVMPMLMRGVPAPRAKQRYIMMDAGREGRACGNPFGNIVDPFGEPVKRAFARFPAALAMGKGMEFITAYLDAAWVRGVDISTEAGLREVAANADIQWNELVQAEDTEWTTLLDENLSEMLSAGLWGVPSFRVSGGRLDEPFACWGQDRIWRVENEIANRA